MYSYAKLKSTAGYTHLMEKMYFPASGEVEELDLPAVKVIAITGKGEPGSESFQQAIAGLYGIAYGLKMGLKFGKLAQPAGYFDFKVAPLEGLWWQDGQIDQTKPEKWQWKVMIMVPSFISDALFAEAQKQAIAKHPKIPYEQVQLEEFNEGRAVQLLHMGPYAQESKSIVKLMKYIDDHGYKVSGKHHEIYMNDPRRVAPEKVKTVLRYPVK